MPTTHIDIVHIEGPDIALDNILGSGSPQSTIIRYHVSADGRQLDVSLDTSYKLYDK